MKIKKLVFTLITAIISVSSGLSQTVKFTELETTEQWAELCSSASKTGKYVFMDIYATWCGPCKMMDENVYKDPSVADFFNNNFICVKVDGESSVGSEIAGRFSLSAYPSLYFLDSEELMIYEAIGYRDPEALIEAGTLVQTYGKRFIELNALIQFQMAMPNDEDEFVDILMKLDNRRKLIPYAVSRIAGYKEQDILNPANKLLVLTAGGSIQSPQVQIIVKNAQAIREAWGPEDFTQYLSDVFNTTMETAIQDGDTLLVEQIEKELIPAYMTGNPERIPEGGLTTRKIYYARSGEYAKYIDAVENYINKYEKDSADFLYSEAYYIVQNELFEPVLLQKANEWIEKVIAVKPEFQSYFLAALINAYKNDKDATQKYVDLAEDVAVSREDKDSLEELKGYLEGK
jgi:thioredoxin 1